MKKKNKILFLMITLALLPLSVKADMGLPVIQPYEAYITNPNGIKITCNNQEYNINENDKVKVVYEHHDSVGIEYKDVFCSGDVTINDIKPVVEEYNPKDYLDEIDKLDSQKKIKIIKENGVDVYSGPSIAYKKISTIPNNTELTYSYSSGDDNGLKPFWLYVEYQGEQGWIKTGDGAAGEKYLLFEFSNELTLLFDTNLTTTNGNKIDTIPKGTLINSGYMTSDDFGGSFNSYYIEYNNQFGRLDLQYEFFKTNLSITLKKDIDMYDSLEKTIDSAENGEYIINMTGNKIGTIPKETVLTYNIGVSDYAYSIVYVEYQGEQGWVLLEYNNGENYEFNNEETNETTTTTTQPQTTKPIMTVEKSKISAIEMIYICIGGAIILSLTALVTIILINKKKKSKKEETIIINNTQE